MGFFNGFVYGSRFLNRPFSASRNFESWRPIQWRRWGRNRKVSIWRRKDEIVSIFVDNISQGTHSETLRSLFEEFGEVCDVFISKRRRANTRNYFGFVRVKGPRNAYRAISQLRGRWVGNSRLFVKEARFNRQSHLPRKSNSEELAKSKVDLQKKEVKTGCKHSRDSPEIIAPIREDKCVKVQINPNIVEELERSLVGECEVPRSVEVLAQDLTNQWRSITKVRDLGPYKFIISFMTKEDMEHALQLEFSPLRHYFYFIEPWNIYQQGDVRRVWLDVMGIPPQVWSRETCDLIASKFGVLVCCDANFENPDSFVVCRLMIDTNIMSYIADVVYLDIEEHCIGKAIYVREGSNVTSYGINQGKPVRSLSWNQWDDSPLAKNHSTAGLSGSLRASNGDEVEVVGETSLENEESMKTVTLVGNVHYDINEEKELLSRKRSACLEIGNNVSASEDDCPPGFQKILNTKKFKRKSKPISTLQRSRGGSKLKPTNRLVKQNFRDVVDVGLSQGDSIEAWSEDDFDSDPDKEEAKTRELGRKLGLGVGKPLSIADLLS